MVTVALSSVTVFFADIHNERIRRVGPSPDGGTKTSAAGFSLIGTMPFTTKTTFDAAAT
jgi:hypothetical protein